MKADKRFLAQKKEFWANVRTISQQVGYTARGTRSISVPTVESIRAAFLDLDLSTDHILRVGGTLTPSGSVLMDYFRYRADVLNKDVQRKLMNKDSAEKEFERIKAECAPRCPLPMNKQKGDKQKPAFMTGMVNMLVEANIGDAPCVYDPRGLTTVTRNRHPLRTLSRRVDGAFPSIVNPIAIWEVKEYYYTTTFGSRVADGVYETLLDGMELAELEAAGHRKIQHVLFVDDYFTWWECGRSYLCRIIDMLHMGYVDEVIFGREVVTRLPAIARQWKKTWDAEQIR